jgi:hypothetical protein
MLFCNVSESNYTVSFTGLDLRKQDDYFRVNFDHFWSELNFLRQLGH